MAALVYGALAAIAAARREQTERRRASRSREIGREPRRIIYPAPERAGFLSNLVRQHRSIPTRGQESNSRTISRSPATAPGEGVRKGSARGGSVANSLARLEGHPLARLCKHQ